MHDPLSLFSWSCYQMLHSILNAVDSLVWWRPTNLVHWRGSDGVSQQLAAEWAINTLIHVVQELCIFIVLTCVNTVGDHVRYIEHTVWSTNRGLKMGLDLWWFGYDYATTICKNNKYETQTLLSFLRLHIYLSTHIHSQGAEVKVLQSGFN